MGTRHITAVVLDGEYKVAQYGQWDGYPDGQGINTLKFLRESMNLPTFVTKVRACHEITEEEHKAQWLECGADPNSEYVTLDVSNTHAVRYPENSRDTGAGILQIIQDRPAGIGINRGIEFAANGLFCEWVWVVDLDRMTFEGYKGFNKSPLPNGERFFFLQNEEKMETEEGEYIKGYYPAKLVASFPLSNLPTNDEFLARFNEDDEITGMEPMISQS